MAQRRSPAKEEEGINPSRLQLLNVIVPPSTSMQHRRLTDQLASLELETSGSLTDSETSEPSEGYDTDRFVPEVEEKFKCPICMMVLRNPIQTHCGHRYCHSCLAKWVRYVHVVLQSFINATYIRDCIKQKVRRVADIEVFVYI